MGISFQINGHDSVNIRLNTVGQVLFNGLPIPVSQSSRNYAVLSGSSSGSVEYYEYVIQGVKFFIAKFVGYTNKTSTAQTITFPIAFTAVPYVLYATESLTVVQDSDGNILGTGDQMTGKVLEAGQPLIQFGLYNPFIPTGNGTTVSATETVLTFPSNTTNIANGTLIVMGN